MALRNLEQPIELYKALAAEIKPDSSPQQIALAQLCQELGRSNVRHLNVTFNKEHAPYQEPSSDPDHLLFKAVWNGELRPQNKAQQMEQTRLRLAAKQLNEVLMEERYIASNVLLVLKPSDLYFDGKFLLPTGRRVGGPVSPFAIVTPMVDGSTFSYGPRTLIVPTPKQS